MSNDIEVVYIGSKPIQKYVNAGKWVLNQDKPVKLLGRGNNIKTTVDTAEIIRREMEDSNLFYNTFTENYIDKNTGEKRNVSVLSIEICGTIKKE